MENSRNRKLRKSPAQVALNSLTSSHIGANVRRDNCGNDRSPRLIEAHESQKALGSARDGWIDYHTEVPMASQVNVRSSSVDDRPGAAFVVRWRIPRVELRVKLDRVGAAAVVADKVLDRKSVV